MAMVSWVMKAQAPFSTPTRCGSLPAYSSVICRPISWMRAWIVSRESSTFIAGPPRKGADYRPSVRACGRESEGGLTLRGAPLVSVDPDRPGPPDAPVVSRSGRRSLELLEDAVTSTRVGIARGLLAVLAIVLAMTLPAMAQVTTGNIAGTVA